MKLLKLAGLIAVTVTLAACNGPVNSNCAGLGALAGAALGAAKFIGWTPIPAEQPSLSGRLEGERA